MRDRQSVAVSFLMAMRLDELVVLNHMVWTHPLVKSWSLVDFEWVGREPIKNYRPPSQFGSLLSVPVPFWIHVLSD